MKDAKQFGDCLTEFGRAEEVSGAGGGEGGVTGEGAPRR